MQSCTSAVIDPIATGHNIRSLRQERGLSVRDLQHYFNFDEPRAIYKWQAGQSLPSIDNLYALSALFGVPMDSIIVGVKRRIDFIEPQDTSCGSTPFWPQRRRYPDRASSDGRRVPGGPRWDRPAPCRRFEGTLRGTNANLHLIFIQP